MSMLARLATMGGKVEKTYIEDVFSTYLYTGTGSTQTINNGIDLAGKGGMVWVKPRSSAINHFLCDTARGNNLTLNTNTTDAQFNQGANAFVLKSSGFTEYMGLGSGTTIASWTFRKAPKFFDVVTYTGNGVAGRTISHSLGQTPGMIIVKITNDVSGWICYHRSLGYTKTIELNLTDAATTDATKWVAEPTSSVFSVGNNNNISGKTYVAYLFAHDTSTDGLIQCGSYTGNGFEDGPLVSLGWEPQYVLIKNASGTGNWLIYNNMTGLVDVSAGGNGTGLYANTSGVEATNVPGVSAKSNGFKINGGSSFVNTSGSTYIYMAIRRGPMRTPTDGTKVFMPVTRTGTGVATTVNTTITPDTVITKNRAGAYGAVWLDRLRDNAYLGTTVTNAESPVTSIAPVQAWDSQTGIDFGTNAFTNAASNTYINYAFQRAPGFFDVVCYTGTGVARTVNHNLGVAPELMIVKCRSNASTMWRVYHSTLGATKYINLNANEVAATFTDFWNNTAPTSTNLTVGIDTDVNGSARTYVAYLFASCPGVSKVGSFTRTTVDPVLVNCGFANGARFVMIKRTDSTGDWLVYDTARGITSSMDKLLRLNSILAEVNTDTVDPYPSGFDATKMTSIGETYIYLAIA